MGLAALRARLEAAEDADNGTPAARARHVDAALALVIALVDELEETEADDVMALLVPLVAHDVRVEISTRRRLARELSRIRAGDRAVAQLRAAEARARDFGLHELELELAAEIDVARYDEVVASSTRALESAAQRVEDPALASKMERELAVRATGTAAIIHARNSLAFAMETVDPHVVAEATSVLCELLVDAGELAEAKLLLEQRPPTRDGRADRALYDDIRRRLGEQLQDPPDEPDGHPRLDPLISTYVTKPHTVAQAIVSGALPAPHELRERAVATIHTADDLVSERIFGPVRSFWCACGRFRGREYANLTCHRCGVELVHRSVRRTRIGCILLEAPALHPWFRDAASALLDAPASDPAELRAQLDALDLAALVVDLKKQIVTAPKARVADQAGKRLAFVEAFRTAKLSPSAVVLDAILVVPPDADLGFDRDRVRAAYAQILAGGGVDALFAAFAS